MVIGHLAVIEYAPIQIHALRFQTLHTALIIGSQALHDTADKGLHIICEIITVRARVCDEFLLIQRLRSTERICRSHAETLIGVTLQGSQAVQKRSVLFLLFGFTKSDRDRFSCALSRKGYGVLSEIKGFVALRAIREQHLEKRLAFKLFYRLVTLCNDTQNRRFHTSDLVRIIIENTVKP